MSSKNGHMRNNTKTPLLYRLKLKMRMFVQQKENCHTTASHWKPIISFIISQNFFKSSARSGVWGTRFALGRHVKDEHVKNAAQDMVQDVAQNVAKDVFGAAEDGGVNLSIFPIAISSGGRRVHRGLPRWVAQERRAEASHRHRAGPPRRPPGTCMCSHRCATTTAHRAPFLPEKRCPKSKLLATHHQEIGNGRAHERGHAKAW